MELWLAALVCIVALVAVGTVVARTWRPQRPQPGLGPVLAGRLVVVLVVTASWSPPSLRPGRSRRP
jgi:hypothetical protein